MCCGFASGEKDKESLPGGKGHRRFPVYTVKTPMDIWSMRNGRAEGKRRLSFTFA